MTQRRKSPANTVARQLAGLALAVPQVVAHRTARMAIAGPKPSARDRREFTGMVLEKPLAFWQAWQGMCATMLQGQQAMALATLRACAAPASNAPGAQAKLARQAAKTALAVVGSGLAPVHRKATANAKRLARTRLR